MSTQQQDASRGSIERRQHFRAKLLASFQLSMRVWKIQPRVSLSVRPMPSQELDLLATELSIGGLTVRLPAGPDQTLPVDPSDRLRIEIRHAGDELLLEGRLCATSLRKLEDGSIVTGIQLRKVDGRLGPIIGALQRADLRIRRGIETPTPLHLLPPRRATGS